MGFDNECILNIQSLPGEYFCPVCRTLIYPNEALQSQCTHLYCKPCLAYVVATTHACPYDGYLVTEADSKPLVESNKTLAETIGKVSVHCLYHRSGCQWQGTLADCVTHCTECSFGNSPVVCNRCGTQIIHRQVQEHAQICPGIQPQAQQVEGGQSQASTAPSQTATQDASSAAPTATVSAAATTATATTAAATAPASAPAVAPAAAPATTTTATGQGQAQVPGSAVVYQQPVAQAQTPEQWYQQQQLQYQQYYQQYPGYDPYQQQYQQYAAQYQQQAYQQYVQPQMQVAPQQPQAYMQPPPQSQPQPRPQLQPQLQPQPQPQPQLQPPQVQPQQQPQPQAHAQLQPQPQQQPHVQTAQPQLLQHVPQSQPHAQQHPPPQSQPQTQPHGPAQIPQMQAQQLPVPAQQPYPQAQPQSHPPPHGQQFPQPHQLHPQSHAQARPPQLQVLPQHQQPVPLQQPSQAQMQPPQSYPQHQPRPQHPPQVPQPPMQAQPHPQPIPQSQPPHPPPHAVSGFQSYPQPVPGAPQQRPMHMPAQQQSMPVQYPPQMQNQFPPQPPPQMRPPHAQMPVQAQQQPTMPPQGPHANFHPSQQQTQPLAHHPGQQLPQHPGMQPHGHQQFPQQAPVHLHPGQPQQGAAPSQHQLHPQQSVRPQGPAYVQQHIPGQTHPQLNVAPTHGMPAQQAQARSMLPNQGIPQQPVQQSPGSGPKLMQPGVHQHSPNQTNMGRPNLRLATPDLQPGVMQQPQLPNSGSQGGLVPASPVTPRQGTTMTEKVSQTEAGTDAKNAEKSESAGKISEHVSDSKSVGNKEKASAEVKEDTQADNNDKATSEPAHVPAKVAESLAKDANVDGPPNKQVDVEGANNKLSEGGESLHVPKLAREGNGIKDQEGKPEEKSGASQGKIAGNVGNNMQAPPYQQPQPTHQNVLPAQERGFSQPGYHDRKPSQIPQQQLGPDDRRGPPPPAGPPLNQERYPQHVPYGHPPNRPEPAMVPQRPPAPDGMFPQATPQGIQERRFPELAPHQMLVHGQTTAPSQMRPQGHNFPEHFPPQVQSSVAPEPFWPPPHAGGPRPGPGPGPGPGMRPPPAGAPVQFPQQALAPQGHTQSHLPLVHAEGTRPPPGEPLARLMVGGPPPRAFDAVGGMMVGGPPFAPEDQMGRQVSANTMEAEAYAIKRPALHDGRQHESHRPLPPEHAPPGPPNVMKMNGMPTKVPVGGMHDATAAYGMSEDGFRLGERFKPFPEEGFNSAHGDRFRPSAQDPSRHASDRRDFEEDLKQFPRPAHLDGEAASKFDGYLSSSRPLDRGPQQFGRDNAFSSRPLPMYQSGAPIPPISGGSEVLGAGQRERAAGLHEHLGRRHDPAAAYPDNLRPVPEFGHYRMDGLPPLRSPGREYGGFSSRSGFGGQTGMEDNNGRDPRAFGSSFRDSKFPIPPGSSHSIRTENLGPGSFRTENLGQAGLPGHLRKGLDGIRSDTFGMQNLPSHLRDTEPIGRIGETNAFGGFRNHLGRNEVGGPGDKLSHMHTGDIGFSGSYPMHGLPKEAGRFGLGSREHDFDALDHSRRRKPGSTGWCRICQVDCETVEGLDRHSQTREHQKMAMDMVLRIKQENAKKHKLTSENAISFEESNKSRKTSFENRGNLQ